jgi:hypothetical protein
MVMYSTRLFERSFAVSAAVLMSFVLQGCSSVPSEKPAEVEPVVLTYSTGSLIAKKDRRPTTEGERQQAQEEIDSIRTSGRTIDRNGR